MYKNSNYLKYILIVDFIVHRQYTTFGTGQDSTFCVINQEKKCSIDYYNLFLFFAVNVVKTYFSAFLFLS